MDFVSKNVAAAMSLSSFVASKCLEYLLSEGSIPKRQKRVLYPPWSSSPAIFRTRCTGCGDCVAACEQRILLIQDGVAVVDFTKGHCSFCGACAKSCPHDALHFDATRRPWALRGCIDGCLLTQRVLCRSCGTCCDKKALVFPVAEDGPPRILAEQCIGCGACVRVCPVGAISFEYRTDQ